MKEVKEFFVTNQRLNKGCSNNGRPKNEYRSNSNNDVFHKHKLSNALPPFDLLAEYEELYPGAFQELISIVKKEQQDKLQMNAAILQSRERSFRIGQISAAVSMFALCAMSVFFMAIYIPNYLSILLFAIILVLTMCCLILYTKYTNLSKSSSRSYNNRKQKSNFQKSL
ncbi:MAG: hypothetical protein AB8B67_02280 [Rickettsiaceae bacterium]